MKTPRSEGQDTGMCGKRTVPGNYTLNIVNICCLYSSSGYWRQPRAGCLSATCPFSNHVHFSSFSAPRCYSRERQWSPFPDCPRKEALCGIKHTNSPPSSDIWAWGSTFKTSFGRSKMTQESKCLTCQIILCFRPQSWEVVILVTCPFASISWEV